MQNAFGRVSEEEANTILAEMQTKNGDNNKYLILIEGEYVDNEGERYRTYEFKTGRQNAYDYIKDVLMSEEESGIRVNAMTSKILVEPAVITENTPRVSLSNMFNIYRFMKEMLESGKVVDETDFDIDSYKDYEPDED